MTERRLEQGRPQRSTGANQPEERRRSLFRARGPERPGRPVSNRAYGRSQANNMLIRAHRASS